ncbi:MAG: hypothetical protein WBA67_14035 [Jannaschia sp.]
MADPKFMIERRPDGGAAVLEIRPLEIASFASELHAEAFVAMLESRRTQAPAAGHAELFDETDVLPAAGMATARPVSPSTPPDTPKPGSAPERAQKVAPPPPVGPVAKKATIIGTKEQFEGAFERLRKGETLTVVADDTGLPMPQLRSAWARRQKMEKAEAEKRTAASKALPVTKTPSTAELLSTRPRQPATNPWKPDEEVDLATAREEDLPDLASRLGRPLYALKAKREAMERQIAKEMGNG